MHRISTRSPVSKHDVPGDALVIEQLCVAPPSVGFTAIADVLSDSIVPRTCRRTLGRWLSFLRGPLREHRSVRRRA
jgi:hypothetical protein